MGFFDLNIPYTESNRHVVENKASLQAKRLKLTLKAMELGYTGVAYNRTIKGVPSDSERCATTLFPISKMTPSASSSFMNAVKFHRQLLNVPVAAPFRQYTRLTLVVDALSQVSTLNSGNPVLKSYDFVAVRPMNQNAFDEACQKTEVDMIAIDFSEKLPFRLKQTMVKAAIKRGLIFEITYSGLIVDVQSRRQMMSNCKLLVDWTKGKNLIFSSAAPSVSELRGPLDVANLACLLGISMERARAAVSKNCRSLLTNALRKRQFYKDAVKIEEIPADKQVAPEQSLFDDWLKWDPISSGEGDLSLDEMENSFLNTKIVAKTVKTINFTAAMNGVPVHGLQVKDLISLTKEALNPPHMNQPEPSAMDIDGADPVCEKNVEQGCVSSLVKQSNVLRNQASNDTTLVKQWDFNHMPVGQTLSSGISNVQVATSFEDSHVLFSSVPKSVNAVFPTSEAVEAFVDNVKIGHQVSGFEYLDVEPLMTDSQSNHEETVLISDEKLGHLVEGNHVPSTTQIEGTKSHTKGIMDGDHTFVELSRPFDKSSLSAAQEEESHVENRCALSICAQKSVTVDRVVENVVSENRKEPLHASESAVMLDKSSLSAVQLDLSFTENSSSLDVCAEKGVALDRIDQERKEDLSLASLDGSAQDSYVEKKQCQEMTDSIVTVGDHMSSEDFSSSSTDVNATISEDAIDERTHIDSVSGHQGLNKQLTGRGKRRRNSTLLSPFKRFINQTHFKRKARR